MADLYPFGGTSNIVRFYLFDSSTGAKKTGLNSTSAGLTICTVCDVEATSVVYAQGSSNIETITTLGVFVAPSTNKCRFKEVDATYHPGLYEFQFANARFAVANSHRLDIAVSGASAEGQFRLLLDLATLDDQVNAFLDEDNALHLIANSIGRHLSDIASKAAQLAFSGSNVLAESAVVSDKTGFALTTFYDAIFANLQSRLPTALTGAGNLKADAQVVTDKTGFALSAGGNAAVGNAVLDLTDAVETGIWLRGATRIVLAALAGRISGAETTTVTIQNPLGTKTRIIASVDAQGHGNRLDIQTDPS